MPCTPKGVCSEASIAISIGDLHLRLLHSLVTRFILVGSHVPLCHHVRGIGTCFFVFRILKACCELSRAQGLSGPRLSESSPKCNLVIWHGRRLRSHCFTPISISCWIQDPESRTSGPCAFRLAGMWQPCLAFRQAFTIFMAFFLYGTI